MLDAGRRLSNRVRDLETVRPVSSKCIGVDSTKISWVPLVSNYSIELGYSAGYPDKLLIFHLSQYRYTRFVRATRYTFMAAIIHVPIRTGLLDADFESQ
jgi:hypothetical protein